MKKITFFLLTFLIKLTLNAQTAGTLDPNFGVAGTASITNEKYLIPYSIDFEAYSGEIATGGTYRTSTGKDVGFVERFDFYGNQRASFGTNGKLEISDLSTTSQQVNEILFTNNSGFIVRGTYKDATNTTVLFLRKYLANGTVDSSFGSGGILTGIYGEIQSSYIYYIKINPVTLHQYLSRYNLADGTLDTTFNSSDFPFLNTDNYYYSSQYRHINFQADGKIILCGYKTINTVKYPLLGRYDGLGNLDTTFGNNGYYVGANGGVAFQSKTQSDGKIIFIDGYADAGVNKVLNRLNANGTVDTSYGTLGSFTYNFNFSGNFIDKIIMQSDDKILFCGTETMNTNGSLSSLYSARVNTSGVLDFWRQDLQSSYSENYSMAKLNDAFVLTYGLSSNANYTLSNSIIQRIYLKAPLISLIGDAYPNGNFVNDLDMSTINGTVYTLNNITLTSGKEVKFRIEHDWKLNWGAATTNPFPSGMATMGLANILIPTSGIYNITFNISTGAYSFINTLSTSGFEKNNMAIYPNPTKSQINLQFPNNVIADKVIITDLSGKIILEQTIKNNTVNTENLAVGMYFIQAFLGGEQFQSKFIKE